MNTDLLIMGDGGGALRDCMYVAHQLVIMLLCMHGCGVIHILEIKTVYLPATRYVHYKVKWVVSKM